jgi:8-amino-7-oxononanoate synthase
MPYALYQNFLQDQKREKAFRALKSWERSPREGCVIKDGRELVNFATNDYLGLSTHPYLRQLGMKAVEKAGAGLPSSRLVGGNHELYDQLEYNIATWQDREAALVFPTGFQANIALMQALCDDQVCHAQDARGVVVFFDKLNHASLYQGVRGTKAELVRYRHKDLAHLQALLHKGSDDNRQKLIVSETIFSMEGDCADTLALAQLAKQYNALLVLDDAHGVGLYGQGGRGLAAEIPQTLKNHVIIMGTFSKALGVMGGFIAGDQWVKDYLLQKAGGLIYSTALSPFVLGAVMASIELLPSLEDRRKKVHALAHTARTLAAGYHISTLKSTAPIVPLLMQSNELCLEKSKMLEKQGFWAVAIRPPTVPPHTARIRLTFHPAHTEEDIKNIFLYLTINH